MGTMTRGEFLQTAACWCQAPPEARAGTLAWPAWMPRMAFAPVNRAPRGDTLVVVFLRGAADALNMVVPHGEDSYYARRPTLAIPRPDDGKVAAKLRSIDLDGFFGLHPSLSPLLEPWQAGHLAVVHACGSPDDSRSHFEAMELMERGVTTELGPASGWIGRHLASLDTGNASPFRALGLGEMTPRSLHGTVPAAALRSITDYHLGGDSRAAARMQQALAALYDGDDALSSIGREALHILRTLESLDPSAYRPAPGAVYPDSDFGASLRQVALLVKAEVGLEVAAVDLGGWDTHFGQGGSEGWMAALLTELAQGLAGLHADLADRMGDLTVVVMSEFGRRVHENASLGTDHGHAGLMLLLGGNVAGGRVHSDWPGLEEGQLFGPGDLAVTIDYRDVLAEVCRLRLNNPALEVIFPDYRPRMRGILRAGE